MHAQKYDMPFFFRRCQRSVQTVFESRENIMLQYNLNHIIIVITFDYISQNERHNEGFSKRNK